jgi:hypothetical protein
MLFHPLRFFCLVMLALGMSMSGEALAHGTAAHEGIAVESPSTRLPLDVDEPTGEVARLAPPAHDVAAATSHCPSGPGHGCGCRATVCMGSSAVVVSDAAWAFNAAPWVVKRASLRQTSAPRLFVLVSSPPRAPPILRQL